jgi:DHA1 family tetracycline resistance protein-like MFS transporter
LFFLGLGLVIIVVQGGLIGKLTDRFGEWTLVIVGPTLVIGAMACYGLLPWAAALPLLIGAGLLAATGRSIHTVASAGLIGRYAEGGRGGATYGVYNGAASLARVVGPLLATFLYDISAAATFATAAVIMLAAIAVLAWRRAIENPAIGYTGAEASSGA